MGEFKTVGLASAALAEECGEVIQVIAKQIRFNGSWHEVPPGKDQTRYEELRNEMRDLIYQWERLQAEIEASA